MLGISVLDRRRCGAGAAVLLMVAAASLGFLGSKVRPVFAVPELANPAAFVLIDPGHGGIDGGATAAGVLEKTITLKVGLMLRNALTADGLAVRLTREEDVHLGGAATRGRHRRDLQERLRLAQEPGVRALISLHANSARDPARSGILILYPRGRADAERLAQILQREMREAGLAVSAPIARTNLFLIRQSPAPAVLVEMGFLSNPSERVRLQDPTYQQRLAKAMAGSIIDFLFNGNNGKPDLASGYSGAPAHILIRQDHHRRRGVNQPCTPSGSAQNTGLRTSSTASARSFGFCRAKALT